MYAKGMSTRDIEDHMRDIYGIDVSATTVSKVTDKILPLIAEWQSRPLDRVYPIVFLDAIHFKVGLTWTGTRMYLASGSAKMRAPIFGLASATTLKTGVLMIS
ncbi:MAG: hypothetical protein DDT32_02194 [Syntrophomonadaceae bacterium]|nr:hypothetical protein [Bacillota bacterium]